MPDSYLNDLSILRIIIYNLMKKKKINSVILDSLLFHKRDMKQCDIEMNLWENLPQNFI